MTPNIEKRKKSGKGSFLTQVNAVKKILKLSDLYQDQNLFPKYSDYKSYLFKSSSFFESYKKILNERFYDYELYDNSLLQFIIYDDLSSSLSYISSPYTELIEPNYQFTGPGNLKENFLLIRYDYQPSSYKEFCHPCAHFHFNLGNQIRLGSKKILNPIAFIFFILRQCYPTNWLSFLERNNNEKIFKNIRNGLNEVPKKSFNDEKELVLY